MVTASHLPIDRNGFKFFSKVGGFFRKKDIQALVADATQVLQKMDQNRLEIRHGVMDKVRNFVLFFFFYGFSFSRKPYILEAEKCGTAIIYLLTLPIMWGTVINCLCKNLIVYYFMSITSYQS